MQYALLYAENEDGFACRTDPERSGAYWGAWMGYMQAISEAGIFIAGNGLQPPTSATSLRLRDGRRMVQDGPFADTKEQLGGFVVIDVPDLDRALEWASRAPCAADGSVEVRPVLPPPPQR